MHIAMYSPAWPPSEHSNGIITYVAHLRKELIRQGHHVSVFTGVVGATSTDEGIHLVDSKVTFTERIYRKLESLVFGQPLAGAQWGFRIGQAISKIHKIDPIDVIEMEESFGWCADVQAVTSLPVVVKLHGPAFLDLLDEIHGEPGKLKIAAEGRALQAMQHITSPSSTTLQETLHYYDLKPALAATVPNPMVPAADDELWSLRQCDHRTILFVGRFDLRKGGDTVLRAFHRLLQSDPTLKLIFVGPDRGIPSASGTFVDFTAFVDSLFSENQRGCIQYLGRLSPDKIPKLRRGAMVTVVASRWDNQPNTVLEALMQGCPVVAVNTGGVSELVEHGVTGLLARHDDLDDFCEQINRMVGHPEQAAQMGQLGRIATRDRHELEKLARDTLDIYQRAIALAP